jgi:hypothetical protein
LQDRSTTPGTAEEQELCNTLKEELISTSLESVRRAGEPFWTLQRKKGQTFLQFTRIFETTREAVDKVRGHGGVSPEGYVATSIWNKECSKR